MANKQLFGKKQVVQNTNAVNAAGGIAYDLGAKASLAQLAVTGTFNNVYYTSAENQLAEVLSLLDKVEPEFIAKLAVYSRQLSYMKDMPALMVAYLCSTDIDNETLESVFNTVINNFKMLSNFVQIIRSGQVMGRKSLGSRPKRLVQNWLNSRSSSKLFQDSIGNNPSIDDVIKMVHPRPIDDDHNAIFEYLLKGEVSHLRTARLLPDNVKSFEAIKSGRRGNDVNFDNIDFRKLTSLSLSKADYVEIALNMGWQALRMNLNALNKQGIFGDPCVIKSVANRLRNREEILRSKVFPYQLLVAYEKSTDLPIEIRNALQDAMEIACENVPVFEDGVTILLDVSGSMRSPITGNRGSATSSVTNIKVAALITAALVRKNPNATVIGFDNYPVDFVINPRDSVMTIAGQLASYGGGGTECATAVKEANRRKLTDKTVIIVSDNQSWIASSKITLVGGGPTATLREWDSYSSRVRGAKLVCLNISPYSSSQVPERKNILNVGGFSDVVFDVIHNFTEYTDFANFVEIIEAVRI